MWFFDKLKDLATAPERHEAALENLKQQELSLQESSERFEALMKRHRASIKASENEIAIFDFLKQHRFR